MTAAFDCKATVGCKENFRLELRMASKPLHLTTPMRKTRKEEATKGAVSKNPERIQNAAASFVNHGIFYLSATLKIYFNFF